MAKRFCDLGIQLDSGSEMYDCEQMSITDIVNTEIEVMEYTPKVTTRYGDNRYVIHFKYTDRNKDAKFFTTAKDIKEALGKAKKDDFPFLTVIKCKRAGNGKRYYFT